MNQEPHPKQMVLGLGPFIQEMFEGTAMLEKIDIGPVLKVPDIIAFLRLCDCNPGAGVPGSQLQCCSHGHVITNCNLPCSLLTIKFSGEADRESCK